MTNEQAINRLDHLFGDLMKGQGLTIRNEAEDKEWYAYPSLGDGEAISLAINALKVRQRLEEAISSMEAKDIWSCHINALKKIVEEAE